MYLCHRQNDTVCTQPVFELNTNNQPFLPSELIVEILLRLPARSLLQFRFVCKLWKTLISDPKFANKHLLISIADPSMSHQRLAFSDCSYPLNSLFENPSTRVIPDRFNGLENDQNYLLGSCNGFLCIYDPHPYQCNMIMYNPSIGLKSNSSPKIIPSPDWEMLYEGFGYDHVNDKYRVLAVVEHVDGDSDDEDFGELLTKIYTFGEDSWRTIQDLPYAHPIQKYGKYVSGTLNWVAHRWIFPTQYVIISFDLDKETYRDVLLPPTIRDCNDYMCSPSLCVLNDCLCLCFVNRTHLVVWSMKEYRVVESWTKLINIPRDKLIFLNSIDPYSFIDLLFISENGVVLLKVSSSSQLFLYNLNSGVLDHPFISINHDVFDPQIYRENLISPPW
ncbi:F-box/kelch-repeat protein At3g23880-like [Trifolium pratense]|uniref:F-box/kelch-repeat protein At3g23880-like n=1 Tax=Trifolium pratense TaxID=57577 RepID=UPI001E6949E1|nr:F-box/kelch-repeat protein At3g23880-like [Trifolium pratense]